LLLTLRGTPTLYYADELGHPSVDIPLDRVRDPFGINMPGGTQGRDPVRTPMPWDRSPNAGFTTGEPWLPLAPDSGPLCVEAERDDPDSMLQLTHRLLSLRRAEPALAVGDFTLLPTTEGAVAYARSDGDRRFIIALDIESKSAAVNIEASGRIVLASKRAHEGREVSGEVALGPDEALVIEVS
jgi:alpha-glucosidase